WANGAHAGRDELQRHLREASLLALPSLEDNCPMVLLEAMAAGVPVVAAKVGGVPDLIEQGETGLFCDPLSFESMSSAIEKALVEVPASRRMALDAKARAVKRFHPKVIALRHLEIYCEVLSAVKA